MSMEYDNYIEDHKNNVLKAYKWIREKLPKYTVLSVDTDMEWQLMFGHDESKKTLVEYKAYDDYFYGNNRSFMVVEDFNYAWLHHIHNNPHHWQYWVLIEDDPEGGAMVVNPLEIPHNYVMEMICDWWSFSWKIGDLYSIFTWYDEHKKTMKLAANTRLLVESILADIKLVLDGEKNE